MLGLEHAGARGARAMDVEVVSYDLAMWVDQSSCGLRAACVGGGRSRAAFGAY